MMIVLNENCKTVHFQLVNTHRSNEKRADFIIYAFELQRQYQVV